MLTYNPMPVRLVSHNIRYATTTLFPGEESWEVRRPRLVSELCFNTTGCHEAFVCCQEVLKNQRDDILEGLNSANEEWACIGVGRDDGIEAGEFAPIFYRPAVFELLKFSTIWLSPSPDVPSKGWDAASPRIVTVGSFRHVGSRQRLLVLNTHLDDQGSTARLEAAKMIVDLADSLAKESGLTGVPVILAGDFNSDPSGEAYRYLTARTRFVDTKFECQAARRYGNDMTYTGFSQNEDTRSRIDFVFVDEQGASGLQIRVVNHAVLSNRFEDGIFISDHRAVCLDLRVEIGSRR